MKKIVGILAFCALALTACQKENGNRAQVDVSGPLSFVVSAPETRTELDGHSVLWVEGDEIRVFGFTTNDNQGSAVFAFTRTNEDGTALFTIKEGESLDAFDDYYASYPAISGITLSASKEVTTMTFPRLNSDPYHIRNQQPAGGQFDPNLAIMTAKYDGERLNFRHGVGYVKITVPYDDVTSIDISFMNNCLGDTPAYNLKDGALSSLSNSSNHITASASFVKGQSYYFAAIPRSNYSIGTTEVSYTITGESSPVKVSTEHFSGKNVAVGKIFDLGAPAKLLSPKITYTAPAKLAYDAESGSFPYAVVNPVSGQSVTATLESGVDWISNIVVGADAVTFTCSKNNAADAQERSAVITLHYTGAADVPVTVTQGVAGSIAEEHDWYFTDYTDAQMKAITGLEADAKAAAGQTWNFGDGLTMVTNSSSKWNKQTIGGIEYKWVATGGKYGSNQKYFSFTTGSAGTVTVLYASGGSATRALTLKGGSTETTDSANVSTGTSDLKTVTFASVAAGTVLLYSKDDNVKIFRITFHGNS